MADNIIHGDHGFAGGFAADSIITATQMCCYDAVMLLSCSQKHAGKVLCSSYWVSMQLSGQCCTCELHA